MIDLPEDLDFCPIMEITAYDCTAGKESKNKLFGFGALHLNEVFKKSYKSKPEIEYD